MGLILDSSVVINGERLGESVEQLLVRVLKASGDQKAALSSIGLTELVHSTYRAREPHVYRRRKAFFESLVRSVAVYPYTAEIAVLAGRIDGEQRTLGVTIPFADLLIGATALEHGFSILTGNPRHFRLIPDLQVIPF